MPDDTILDMVDNIEPMYNAKLRLFDQWMGDGDAWSRAVAFEEAKKLAEGFAEELESGEFVRGRYSRSDVRRAADEILEQFEEHREEEIKAATEKPRQPVPRAPLTPEEEEFARKCEANARSIGIPILQMLVPASQEAVRKALETGDIHLNTIPLRKWDAAAARIGKPGLSLSEKVCALKHVAKYHYV